MISLLALLSMQIFTAEAALTLTVTPGSVTSCGTVEATVGLTPAPATAATVALSTNNPAVSLPATAVITAGATSTKVTVTGLAVRANTPVILTASHTGATATANLTVTPYPKPAYSFIVEDVGTLGGDYSVATGITNDGMVVGYSPLASGLIHSFRTGRYGPNGPLVDIDPTSSEEMLAWDVNSAGQIVGYTGPTGGRRQAFRAEPTGTILRLTTPGQTNAEASAINANGQVTGWFLTSAGNPRAFRTNATGIVTDLGILAGGTVSFAYGINSVGRVAGYANDSGEFDIGFVTTGTGTIASADLLGDYVYAYDVNNSNRATGQTWNYDAGHYHAFRSSADGTVTDLGGLSTFDVYGTRINSTGAIVGTAYSFDATENAFFDEAAVYYSDDLEVPAVVDLNTLIDPEAGWDLVAANDINDAGQIVGYGWHNNAWRAYRLTPLVPNVLYGDADGDGAVGMPDVVALLRMAGGLMPHGNPIVSDVAPAPACNPRGFGDGFITLADAVRVARYLAGNEPVWP